jgi:hypothetical protein
MLAAGCTGPTDDAVLLGAAAHPGHALHGLVLPTDLHASLAADSGLPAPLAGGPMARNDAGQGALPVAGAPLVQFAFVEVYDTQYTSFDRQYDVRRVRTRLRVHPPR